MKNKNMKELRKNLRQLNKEKNEIDKEINKIEEELSERQIKNLKRYLKEVTLTLKLSEEDLNVYLQIDYIKLPKKVLNILDNDIVLYDVDIEDDVSLKVDNIDQTISIESPFLKKLNNVIEKWELKVDDSELIKKIDEKYDELEEIKNIFIY